MPRTARVPRTPDAPSADDLIVQILATWRRHNEILLFLLDHVPPRGMSAVPTGSRGRDVAHVFEHVERVRVGWLVYHETGKHPRLPRSDRSAPVTRALLRRQLRASGSAIEAFLARALRGEAQPRMFGRQPMRWMGYLVAHESHHRGQIVLALKQAGLRLPEKVAMQGLWGRWIFGT